MARVAAALLQAFSRRTRVIWLVGVFVATLGRVSVVGTAYGVSNGEVGGSVGLALAAGVIFAIERAVAGALRVGAECDALLSMSRSFLEGDVMFDPDPSARSTMGEGASSLPQIASASLGTASGILTTAIVLPFVLPKLPFELLLPALVAMVVLLAVMALFRGRLGRLQSEVMTEQQRVYDAANWVLEGRLEVAARGGEATTLASLDRTLAQYRRVAQRNGTWSALLGRAPLAAALLFVVVFTVVTRPGAVTTQLGAQALVLTAIAAPPIAAALSMNEIIRAFARLGPFAALLALPKRAELARGGAVPTLPGSIETKALSFAYETSEEDVLRELTLHWGSDRALLVAGKNGAGKSTLLKLILGLRRARVGEILVGGAPFSAVDLLSYRRKIAYLPQRPYLGEPHTTVREAIALVVEAVDDAAAERALARVDLLADLKRRGEPFEIGVGTLSAGQKQRLALARMLMTPAKMFLLDEPDANLDRAGVALLEAIVGELVAGGAMVAIVAHDQELLSIQGTRIDI